MSRIRYIILLTLLSSTVKFSLGDVWDTGLMCHKANVAGHAFEKPFLSENLFCLFSVFTSEQDDKSKHNSGLSQSATGFSSLFGCYGVGKIIPKAGVSSFIIFESDSSPPHLI